MEATDEKLQSGKLRFIPSMKQLQNAKEYMMRKMKTSTNEKEAILALMAEEKETGQMYVRRFVTGPDGNYTAVLACDDQLKLFNILDKQKKLMIFTDATGSVVKPMQGHNKKRVLTYSLLARFQGKTVVISRMITDSHNSESIRFLLHSTNE